MSVVGGLTGGLLLPHLLGDHVFVTLHLGTGFRVSLFLFMYRLVSDISHDQRINNPTLGCYYRVPHLPGRAAPIRRIKGHLLETPQP
jgi:hypothetical protein